MKKISKDFHKDFSQNKNKLLSLNFNLKNEILMYLPLNSLFEEIIKVNKSFKQATDNCSYVKIFKANFIKFIKEIEISKEKINKIKSEFLFANLPNEKLNEICAFLLLHKKLLYGNCLKLNKNKEYAFEILLETIKYKIIKNFHFTISNFGLCESELGLLFMGILSNTSIEKLTLSRNCIGKAKQNFNFFLSFFEKNFYLKYLDLGANSLGLFESNFKIFCEALALNNSITELDISYNYLANNSHNLKYLSQALKLNNKIEILNLDNNSIGAFDSDLLFLAEGLVENYKLKKIKLNANKIGSNIKDVFYLCKVFLINKTLNFVELSHNLIGGREEDVIDLYKALKQNKGLIYIELENNSIEDENESLERLTKEKKQLDVLWKNVFPY